MEFVDIVVVNKVDGEYYKEVWLVVWELLVVIRLIYFCEVLWCLLVFIMSVVEGRGLVELWDIVECYC